MCVHVVVSLCVYVTLCVCLVFIDFIFLDSLNTMLTDIIALWYLWCLRFYLFIYLLICYIECINL